MEIAWIVGNKKFVYCFMKLNFHVSECGINYKKCKTEDTNLFSFIFQIFFQADKFICLYSLQETNGL